jgi:site-specific recombinase XerD
VNGIGAGLSTAQVVASHRGKRGAGVKPTGNFHILRHTFCSHLAMRGAVPKAIQELAGHAQLVTMRYMHLAEGQKEQAIRLLDRRTTAAPASI